MGSTAYSIEGALYELVARGNKDVYFVADDKQSKNLFDNRYEPQAPFIQELRRLPPLNAPDFGRSFEFQIEIAGDVFVEPTLLITLPSWLPPTYETQNPTSLITDSNGVSYGYTNGIGYFLFEKIQLLQDNILLQEFSGDSLWATSRSRGSLNSAFLDNRLVGLHNGTALALQRNATPGLLRLRLPLFGCQSLDDGGIPSLCIPQQSYRLRCFLRKLEDLVEASSGAVKPAPWGTTLQIQTSAGGPVSTFQTLQRYEIGAPHVLLSTRHIYTEPDVQKALKESRLEIPFERLYENIFTQNQNDYAPLSRGGTAAITRRLEGVHPAARIVNFFRSAAARSANQLWNITNTDISGGEFYGALKLVIAGRDRETLFSPLVWHYLVQHAKEERDSGLPLAIMNWTRGDVQAKKYPAARQPDGTINMSTADRPTLYMELAPVGVGPQETELRSIVETWASMVVEDFRATLWFAN